jgi:selenide,water dikinase
LAPGELSHVIGGLDCSDDNLVVGIDTNDDASVYKLDENRALVQTVDYITPVVDDPFVYGQIAAANSLSDIFAMGADVLTAMNLVGFDGCNHPKEVLGEILHGGLSKVKECGGVLAGGHTIETPEMTYGLSVSGLVHPDKIFRNNTPKAGDVLILTKPLGLGILTTAIKADMLEDSSVEKIAQILAQLNFKASLIARDFNVSACTDVTGFGLAGHAYEMSGGKFTLEFDFNSIPIIEEAKEMASMGIIPAGTYANKDYVSLHVEAKKEYEDEILFFDAQTSGGLLISINQKEAPELLKRLKNEGYENSSIVANVKEFEGKSIKLV